MKFCDRQFIYDSASCREGKGTLFAIERVQRNIRSVSDNFGKEAYNFKFDIKGYFMSMHRDLLYELAIELLDKQYPLGKRGNEYQTLKFLWRKIIFDNPTKGVRRKGELSDWDRLKDGHSLFTQPWGQGIVIGNLSSQVLSNILMNKFDRYVTIELGYKHYVRYVDDFIITTREKEKLSGEVWKMEEFLSRELGLELHPKKRYVQEIHKKVEFVGARIGPGYKLPSRRIENNFYRAVRGYMMGDEKYTEETIISYLGYLKHFKSVKIIKRAFLGMGVEYGDLMAAKAEGGNELSKFLRSRREELLNSLAGENAGERKEKN